MTSTVRTSYTLIPNRKYRRSNRRSKQHCNILDTDSQSLSTLGYFKTLPLEIFQMVLDYLSVKDISMLSMVSKTISNRLINYISTPSGNRRLLLQDFHNLELPGKREGSSILEHYKSLGDLLVTIRGEPNSLKRILLQYALIDNAEKTGLNGKNPLLFREPEQGLYITEVSLKLRGIWLQPINSKIFQYLTCGQLEKILEAQLSMMSGKNRVPQGLLLKRCTLLLPTKDRLKYIHKIFSEILTAGWDELECHRVFNFLCELSNLPRKVQTVVSSRPGSARKLELRIRLFCRSVLLNHWIHRSDSAFWLTRILKPWPMVNQARLLYILFGPVSSLDGHVVWQKMIEGPTDETSLKGLADAIKLLYDTEAREWTADDVISLVDELSVVPREWLIENNARLLILSGNNICFTFMASKAVNGRTVELARLVVFLALVCEKDLYCMDWAVKMMQKVCKVFSTPGERNNFLQSVENAFAHMIMDMLQSVLSGDRDEEDSSFLNLFHLVNAQANFHKEVLYLTVRSNTF